ncbi:MAG: family 43 glycosylhydrolase [Bacteroidales bacterium]|jgi:hypothetical protein
MRYVFLSILFISIAVGCSRQQPAVTICNPMDLSYRFALDKPSRREAADPSVVYFRDEYYLFASKSGGYWHSDDLTAWDFIETNQIPTEEYAPTAIAIGDTLFFLASSNEKSTVYKSTDPLSGQWEVAEEALEIPVWDPAFFMDDDQRLYLYWGCSDQRPLYGVEVDYCNGFAFVGGIKTLVYANPLEYGWEVPGDYNTLVAQSPWIEGPWVTKYNGKYYLQYAGPGTEYKSYADAVYLSENPLGPFKLQKHNPSMYKPEGFAAGAGHGSSFADNYGNFWQIGTMTISQKHMFERRLGLFPVFLDEDGTYYSITKFGDYPMIVPQYKINRFEDFFPGWMLLTYKTKVTASSTVDSLPASNMTDEDIRTYWAAESGDKNEFALIDLGNFCEVYALQINFAEHNTTISGREKDICHRFTVTYSLDGKKWEMLEDRSENKTDNSHVYIPLDDKVLCRYLKVNNIEVPGGHFAISGFRAFGKGSGKLPGKIECFTAERNPDDMRSVNLSWSGAERATGYNICYGTDKNKLYLTYTVYEDTKLTINSLNARLDYYFTIESFNENGITTNEHIVRHFE